jgi:hypothetical protein
MKKLFIAMIVAAFALGACGKKKDAAKPMDKDMKGSATAPTDQTTPPPAEGEKPAPETK